MGPIELILGFFATWVMVALVFVCGFVVGRGMQGLAGDQKVAIARRGTKTVAPQIPLSPVRGVNVSAERLSVINRAKQEFNLNDQEAAKFADVIVARGSAELGRLHAGG